MSTTATPDEALNPGEAYRRRVSRALWFRHPARPSRFLFAPASPMGLFIESLGTEGTAAFVARIKALKAQGLTMTAGAVLVNTDGRFVFCGRNVSADFLRQLAEWAGKNAAAMPAIANLIDAGYARTPNDLGSEESIAALHVETLEIQRDPALWTGLLEPTAATMAAVLAPRLPGERMWFWLSAAVPVGVVPLLVQPVAWDPDHNRMDRLIRQVEAAGAGAADDEAKRTET